MPVSFTPITPVTITEFDFEGLLEAQSNYLGEFSFFQEWKKYWLDIFKDQEEQLQDYIKKFPNSNPILQRIKYDPSLLSSNYEMFTFEHVTEFGVFHMHFDIEKMKHFQATNKLSKEVLNISDIYIDPDTPVLKEKLQDTRLPYFVRIFGMELPFLCVDGNKRIQARIKNRQQSFDGYVFSIEHCEMMFFGPIDMYYYILLYELNALVLLINQGYDEKSLYQSTQMYLLSNRTLTY